MKITLSYLTTTVFLSLLLILSPIVGAIGLDQLVTIPTADLISGKGFIRGEILPHSERMIEGVFLVYPQIEVGGGVNFYKEDSSEFGIRIKDLLVNETKEQPAVAVGIRDEDLYFVVSKHFSYGIKGHLGVGNGQFNSLFVGISKVLNPISITVDEDNSSILPSVPIELMGEYVDEEINLGLRAYLQNNLMFDLALLDLRDFKAGVSFSF